MNKNLTLSWGCVSHLDSSYNSSEVFPAGFTVIRKERMGRRGGGFVLFKQDLYHY